MIGLDDVLKIHEILIYKFGGVNGIRDKNLLASAINRPFQTFNGKELYPTTEEKAAAMIESVIQNHPFIDGNKRIGYVLMRLILLENKIDISADKDIKYNFVIKIASGKLNYSGILNWIKENKI